MNLKERIEEVVVDLGYHPRAVSTNRNHIEHGVPSWQILVEWTNKSEQTYRSEFAIAKANGMSEEHIAKVVKSYLQSDPLPIKEEFE